MAIFLLSSFLLLFSFRRVLILPNHSAFLESPVPSNGSSFIKDSLNQKQKVHSAELFSTAHSISLPFFYTNGSNIHIRFYTRRLKYTRFLTPQSSYLYLPR